MYKHEWCSEEVFGTGKESESGTGIARAKGVCTCDDIGKCTCETKVDAGQLKSQKKKIESTTFTPCTYIFY